MSTSAQYAATPNCGIAQVSTANTNRDGTGTISTVLTAGASGSRIDAINIKAIGTTTSGMIRLYINDGSNSRLLTEVPVQATTPSSVIPAWEIQLNTNTLAQVLPIIIPTGYSLTASTNNAETFNVIVIGGDF